MITEYNFVSNDFGDLNMLIEEARTQRVGFDN